MEVIHLGDNPAELNTLHQVMYSILDEDSEIYFHVKNFPSRKKVETC